MKTPKIFPLLFTITLCLLASGPAVQATEAPFSTNDLSILFPIETEKGNVPKYVVQPGDKKWRVLSHENFQAVLKGAESQKVFLNAKLRNPQNWYLVGMRYAPCTLFHGAAIECKEQIRFVFQSLNAERGLDGFDDYAIHVVFNFKDLKSPEISARLESFRSLKNKFSELTLDQPLAVSPALSSPKGADYFQALQIEIIQKHINDRAPSLITFMGLGQTLREGSNVPTTDSDHWIFLTGDVNNKGLWQIAPLNVGAPLKSEHIKLDFEDESAIVSNVKASKNQLSLFNPPTKNIKALAVKMLDQKQTNDHNVSCASCHHADAHVFPVLFFAEDEKEKSEFMKTLNSMMKDQPRVTEVLIENEIHVGKMGFEVPAVRIFGYLDGRPLLSQRVVLDSALAVEQANKLLGLRPKPQLATAQERENLITCLYLKEHNATLKDCLGASFKLDMH